MVKARVEHAGDEPPKLNFEPPFYMCRFYMFYMYFVFLLSAH